MFASTAGWFSVFGAVKYASGSFAAAGFGRLFGISISSLRFIKFFYEFAVFKKSYNPVFSIITRMFYNFSGSQP